jgi:hypothetical protein
MPHNQRAHTVVQSLPTCVELLAALSPRPARLPQPGVHRRRWHQAHASTRPSDVPGLRSAVPPIGRLSCAPRVVHPAPSRRDPAVSVGMSRHQVSWCQSTRLRSWNRTQPVEPVRPHSRCRQGFRTTSCRPSFAGSRSLGVAEFVLWYFECCGACGIAGHGKPTCCAQCGIAGVQRARHVMVSDETQPTRAAGRG